MTVTIRVRVGSPASQAEALLASLASQTLGQPVTVTALPDALLSFGGAVDNRFPPVWTFAPVDEQPSRLTRRALWTGPDLPEGLKEALGGIPCTTAAEADDAWHLWAEALAQADVILTDRVDLAALANGMLKPALLLGSADRSDEIATLPFTLSATPQTLARCFAGYDRNATMPDLLNWKRQTFDRLHAAFRAEA